MNKIKSRVGVLRSVKHNTRENIPENADKKLTPNNKTNGDTKICMNRYTEKLPKKIRKNAVHAVEVVMTASPDFTGDWNKFLSSSRDWSDKLFGGAENCVSWAVHLDESTPHIHAVYLPLVDGKLNAKKVIGGPSNKMQLLQTDYYKKVGKKFDMERGVKNTHVKHKEIKKFNKYVQETTKELSEQKENLIKVATSTYREEIKSYKSNYAKAETDLPEVEKKESAKKYRLRVLPVFDSWILTAKERNEKIKKVVDEKTAIEKKLKDLKNSIPEKIELAQKNQKDFDNINFDENLKKINEKNEYEIKWVKDLMKSETVNFSFQEEKFSLENGISTVASMFQELEDFEGLTPFGVKKLSEKMEKHNFKCVGEAKEYMRKKNIKTLVEIPENSINHNHGVGR